MHTKCAKTDLRATVISENFPVAIPQTPLNKDRGGEEHGVWRENGKGGEEKVGG